MSSFSADWLALREPADTQARARLLTARVIAALPPDRPAAIVDLAAGTGSNTRYLSEYFRTSPDWLLLDYDATLLTVARRRLETPIRTQTVDLSQAAAAPEWVSGRDLVTASALLDLVSAEWLAHVLPACRAVRAVVLFALNYDGRLVCTPSEPEDEQIRNLVNAHQRTDKGFGPALGADASPSVSAALRDLGYEVIRERSDWQLAPDARELQRQLITGWAQAAREMAPHDADTIARWHERRLTHVDAHRSHLIVGHEDVAGLPS
jgi:protein-L-isoaspartate O-methyltransferase